MGAHHCLDSLPVIRFMHSSVHVLDSWGDQLISRVCDWSCSSWAGWAGSKQQHRAGSQQRLQQQAQCCLKYKQYCENGHMQLGIKVQAILWEWTHAIRYVGEREQFYPKRFWASIRFLARFEEVTAHQPLDSCIATKSSGCGTDSRNSARWGVQRSV